MGDQRREVDERDLPPLLDAIIIGSGFAGICQAIKLKEHGIHKFLILEKESDLGGTWRDNTYPGAACDIPSVLYTYSFEAKRSYDSYLRQPVILDYMREVADKHKVTKHICYGKSVDRLVYAEDAYIWDIYTLEGEQYKARFVISAVGQLHHPKIPNLPGSNEFQGESIHTAQFGSRRLENFVGKQVAVIGSGASAIQLIPELQKVCKQIHLYHRTPSYVL
jgi:cation diffusion facilitator CzcD-associated flavoprotein CzcO